MADADFTIADVLAWARTKPADETYVYIDGTGGCALCQFLIETGRAAQPKVWPGEFDNGDGAWAEGFRGEKFAYPIELETPLHAGTFGGLVERLETIAPNPPSEWTRRDAYMADMDGLVADFAQVPA